MPPPTLRSRLAQQPPPIRRRRPRPEEEVGEDEEGEDVEPSFSNGKTILVLAIVVGCFAVLWPKIFYPMFFGGGDGEIKIEDGNVDFVHPALGRKVPGMHPGTGPVMGAHPPGMMPGVGPQTPPIRTIEKEWAGRGGPMPGMRPTIGGPGTQPQQSKGGGTMSLVMPVYTVAIIIFFVYTTMKIMFKNKDEEEEEEIVDYTKYNKEQTYQQQDPYYRYGDPHSPGYPSQPQPGMEQPTVDGGRRAHSVNTSSTPETKKKVEFRDPLVHEQKEAVHTQENLQNMDPRDVEISLLKRRLEETERAMERIVQQMGAVTSRLAPQVIARAMDGVNHYHPQQHHQPQHQEPLQKPQSQRQGRPPQPDNHYHPHHQGSSSNTAENTGNLHLGAQANSHTEPGDAPANISSKPGVASPNTCIDSANPSSSPGFSRSDNNHAVDARDIVDDAKSNNNTVPLLTNGSGSRVESVCGLANDSGCADDAARLRGSEEADVNSGCAGGRAAGCADCQDCRRVEVENARHPSSTVSTPVVSECEACQNECSDEYDHDFQEEELMLGKCHYDDDDEDDCDEE